MHVFYIQVLVLYRYMFIVNRYRFYIYKHIFIYTVTCFICAVTSYIYYTGTGFRYNPSVKDTMVICQVSQTQCVIPKRVCTSRYKFHMSKSLVL